MKAFQFVLLFLVAFAAAKKDYSGFKVLEVTPGNLPQLRALNNLQENYEGFNEVEFWKSALYVKRPVHIQVAPAAVDAVIKQLEKHGMTAKVSIEDMGELINQQMAAQAQRKSTDGTFQLDAYHDYDEIVSYLSDLASQNEGTELKSIGQTIEGREIQMFSIASGDKPAISIECNIHAREWITGAACLNFIANLVTNEAEKDLRDAYDWYFIPIANPDGFAYTWSDNRMWRKNRREQGMCDGVDLNRNFDANFGGAGSSSSKCSEAYHGEAAFSEPETKAERDFILSLKGRLVAHWSFHSYGDLYLIPYCYTYDPPAGYEKMLAVAQTSGEAIKNTYGTQFSIGECASTIYIASGGTHDWVFDAASPKFSATMELRDQGRYGFLLPEDQIIPVYEEVWNGIKAAIAAIE